ncbi:MAG: cation transporter, partial [bacterium]|nr:cation transporter [bacterium]
MERTTSLNVVGMHCASCAITIEKELKRLPGIQHVAVSYAAGTVEVVYDEAKSNERHIINTIKSLGYSALSTEKPEQELAQLGQGKLLHQMKQQVIISGILSGVLLVMSMVPGLPKELHNKWVMWLLATPVQFWIGWQFYRNTWLGLKVRAATMDSLIALGTTVAYFYSVFVLFFES